MLRLRLALATFGAFIALVPVGRAEAAPHTYVISPAALIAAIDASNAGVLAQPDASARGVKIHQGTVRLGKSTCGSLPSDPRRVVTRVRLLGSPLTAAFVTGARAPEPVVADVLVSLGAASWQPPATGIATRQPSWTTDASPVGMLGFATQGFALGDQTGALDGGMAADRRAAFRAILDVTPDPGVGPTRLAVTLTTETRLKRPGRAPKRIECVGFVEALPADVDAVASLLDATPLSSTTRLRFGRMVDEWRHWDDVHEAFRAARSARALALEVARRSTTEFPAANAEALIARALAAVEGYDF